ncbi:hypothetical protein CGH26_28820, partial [Vibrio parahaemolyticus]
YKFRRFLSYIKVSKTETHFVAITMSNPESIFPKGSIAYENEQKQNPSIKSEAEAETFFPKTSIAYQN